MSQRYRHARVKIAQALEESTNQQADPNGMLRRTDNQLPAIATEYVKTEGLRKGLRKSHLDTGCDTLQQVSGSFRASAGGCGGNDIPGQYGTGQDPLHLPLHSLKHMIACCSK